MKTDGSLSSQEIFVMNKREISEKMFMVGFVLYRLAKFLLSQHILAHCNKWVCQYGLVMCGVRRTPHVAGLLWAWASVYIPPARQLTGRGRHQPDTAHHHTPRLCWTRHPVSAARFTYNIMEVRGRMYEPMSQPLTLPVCNNFSVKSQDVLNALGRVRMY